MVSAPTETVVEDQVDDVEETDVEETEQPTGRRAERQARQAAEERASRAEARVVALQSAEISRLAGAVLAQGADVLLPAVGGVELDDLLDPETGEVDPDLVRAAAEAVIEARPGLRAARRVSPGSPDGGARQPAPRPTGWADVIGSQR